MRVLTKDGQQQLASPLVLSVWRAPTDNERGVKSSWSIHGRDGANLDRSFSKVYSCSVEGNTVTVTGSLAGVGRDPYLRYGCCYTFTADGKVTVHLRAELADWFTRPPKLSLPPEYAGFAPKAPYLPAWALRPRSPAMMRPSPISPWARRRTTAT